MRARSARRRPDAVAAAARRGRADGAADGAGLSLRAPSRERLVWGAAVGGLLLLAFVLRIWGNSHGLPYAYNADENAHFVTRAIGLFGHDWDPNYYINPPAYTYLVHLVLGVWYGGRAGVSNSFAADPTRSGSSPARSPRCWARSPSGCCTSPARGSSTAASACWRPASSPSPSCRSSTPSSRSTTCRRWPASASRCGAPPGILRDGRMRDYVLAGLGLGLACATKYTGGIVLLPIVAAAIAQFMAAGGRAGALRGIAIVAALALASFFVANPYSVLDFSSFWDGLTHQSDASGDAAGKLGLTQDSGYAYYLWSFGWGLGWMPLLFAVGGAVRLFVDERRLFWMLVPPIIVFVLFMGSQERYFGRWLMPVFPFVCVLAAYGAIELADRLGRLAPALRPTIVAAAVVLLCGQGFVYSLHSGLVLSREDTRNIARDWMVSQRAGDGTKIVVEPVVPDQWAQDIGNPSPLTTNGNRWNKYPLSRRIDPATGEPVPGAAGIVNIEDFERVLRPELVDDFEEQGYCWVVVGSTQRGRAEVEPEAVPQALAYYKELERRSDVAYQVSPYSKGKGPVAFNFDWTFNYYPLAYNRPGPTMTIYRLRGGGCAEEAAANP